MKDFELLRSDVLDLLELVDMMKVRVDKDHPMYIEMNKLRNALSDFRNFYDKSCCDFI